jgi:hypothetical protein
MHAWLSTPKMLKIFTYFAGIGQAGSSSNARIKAQPF